MLENPCKNGKCTNTIGGYKCDCNMGYKNTGSIKMPVCVGKSLSFSLSSFRREPISEMIVGDGSVLVLA